MKITLVAGGGGDVYYELELLSGLVSNGIDVDFIGSDYMKDAHILKNENVTYYNLRGDQDPDAPIKEKIIRIVKYYLKLVIYAYKSNSKLIHIQWLTKLIYFDRTFLNVYYKFLGKKLVFTAHNINSAERDENDSLMNRLTLKFMYKIVDHIIVHTNKMKTQLTEGFNIRENKVTVIPYGINNMVHRSELTGVLARKKLHLERTEKIILFFGVIKPYKGLENLLSALVNVKEKYNNSLRLIIAGKIDKTYQEYWKNINKMIKEHNLQDYVIKKTEFIPNEEIEVYFKAADILVLPYNYIFQSGVLFLAYNFGLPVIATDVGSLREDIVEGKTGFICQPKDPEDLVKKIDLYFHSDLYKNLEINRERIINYTNEKYSWEEIAEKTYDIYKKLL